MRVAIYARVSSEDQFCEIQLEDPSTGTRNFCRRMGWGTPVEYVEKLSGKEGGKRPELERLLEDARQRKFDAVLCWKMDRFGRSTLDTLTNIKTLDLYKVRFLCSAMSIDTDDRSPTGRFILQIFAAIAELDRGFIRERTEAGYKAYRASYAAGRIGKGKQRESKSKKNLPVGRPRRVVDRRRAIELAEGGASVRAIARKLGIGVGTAHRLLKPAA